MSNDNTLSDSEARVKAYAMERARYFPVREEFWLDLLNGDLDREVIFVCGHGHIDSFTRLLGDKHKPHKVTQGDVALPPNDRQHVVDTARYLSDHPELEN